MRELELAGHPAIDPKRAPRDGRTPWPRTAFVVSMLVHAIAVYALALQQFADVPAAPRTVADYFVLELPAPRPGPVPEPATVPEPAAVPEEVPAEPPAERVASEPPLPATEAEPEPTIAEPAQPTAEAGETPIDEAAPPAPAPLVDFDEERRRAAREVVTERAAENNYLTFSMDDVAPPRPKPEEPTPSIFDGGGGADFGGRSVGTLGQQRTKFGRKLAELCNALTGGFGAAFMGFGLFSACASPDTGPSGLFPEVRPAYLDLMPECVDTRDTAPALALEAPFPTVKCRLVKQVELEEQP